MRNRQEERPPRRREGACTVCLITLPLLPGFECQLSRCPGVDLFSQSRAAEVDQSVPDTGADDGAVAVARVSHLSKGLDSITLPNNSGFNDLGVNCKTGSGMSWQ